MPSTPNLLPNKRSTSTERDSHGIKRARLEYILCGSAPNSSSSEHTSSHPDAQSKPTSLQSSFHDPDTHPSILPYHSSPRPPVSPHAQVLDKFTKSRVVGQSHRDNEKEYVKALRIDVEKCRDENILLFALFTTRYKHDQRSSLPLHLISDVRCSVAHDFPEDYNVSSDYEATRRGFVKLSNSTANLLEQCYISPALAVVLLDFIMYRRNIIKVVTDRNEQGYRVHNRRSGMRIALSRSSAREIIDLAVRLFAKEERGEENIYQYIDRRLGSLCIVMEKWSKAEAIMNPPTLFEVDTVENEFTLSSVGRPGAAEVRSAPRRAQRAKPCSRCNMIKSTGSGHGRSLCNDGYSISSHIPYCPVPSPRHSESTSADFETESTHFSNQ